MQIAGDPEKIQHIKEWLGAGSINLFGSPFAGKDTQGRKLAQLLDAQLLGGGDILRGSKMPDRIKEFMKTGELIPTKDYLEIVLPYLKRPALAGKPLVLSSVGRWHGEEPGVLEATDLSGHPIKAVFFLAVTEAKIRERWQQAHQSKDRGQRYDDDSQAFEIRLDEFREKTLPVIEFYKANGLLTEIDGSGTPDMVTELMLQQLYKLAS